MIWRHRLKHVFQDTHAAVTETLGMVEARGPGVELFRYWCLPILGMILS